MKIKYRNWGNPPHDRFKSTELEADLLPCPKCRVDGEQLIVASWVSCESRDLDDEQAAGQWAVQCGDCGLVLPGHKTAAEAVAEWNDRPTVPVYVNLNQRFLIRETEHGREVFDRHYRDCGLDPAEYRQHCTQPDGRLRLELWHVMQIYGSSIVMGGPEPFDLTIEAVPER
jgi:hypothetical protein